MGDHHQERPIFELGLVMAGAISAGAYTAGVVDFLLEALDAIDDVRAGRDTAHLEHPAHPVFDPPHRVRLRAISGTSAGAMVAAITTAILGTRVPPVSSASRPLPTAAMTGNPLYDSWVRRIHYDALLGTAEEAAEQAALAARYRAEFSHQQAQMRDALAGLMPA